MTTNFDPFSERYRADPYDDLANLRTESPVHKSPLGFTLLTRYRDVSHVLKSRDFGVLENSSASRFSEGSVIGKVCADAFLFRNDPAHGRLRALSNRAFTPARVRQLEARIKLETVRLLDRLEHDGPIDLVQDLAYPLPLAMVCDLVGIPEAERDQVLDWSHALCPTLEPVVPPDLVPSLDSAAEEFGEYLKRRLYEPSSSESAGLLASLKRGLRSGELTESELVASVILILAAGHETTSSLIATGLMQLVRCPEDLERIKRGEVDSNLVVEEMLRYESPIAMYLRWPRRDISIDGVSLPEGEPVALHIGAANRDPDVFAAPDEFVLDRVSSPHLAFGAGVHSCLGPALARAEARAVVDEISRRGWRMKLRSAPTWKDSLTIRSLDSLEVDIEISG